eukprot:Skav230983  [mRNA]  locus=scaffold629:33299:39033:+ [translate_table: standard]
MKLNEAPTVGTWISNRKPGTTAPVFENLLRFHFVGIATFQLDVFLADFVLGVPEDASSGADHLAPPENREIWTAFEAKENSTNEACAALCRHTLQCFMHYVGREGCFMAFGDHHGLETRPGPPLLLAKGRRISGKVAGCGANRTGDECSMRADLKESISFAGVQPDWRSKAAAIEFSLEVETGEQKHEAEATFIQVQQGPPVPVDAIGILLGESDNETALLNSTTSVDRYGKVSLEMAEYQPFNIDSLRLLLLVMLPDRAPWLQKVAVFASVRGVEFFLTEPEQLQRVAQALRLAPNLKWLEAACGACPLAPAPWPRWPLAPQLRELRLADFVLPTLPEGAFRNFTGLKWLALGSKGIRALADKSFEGLGALKELNLRYNDIQTLAEKTFEGLGALTELDLNVNRIQTLPEKTFEGLGALKRLDLCRNDPGLKRPAVCQQKEIECYGPWEES